MGSKKQGGPGVVDAAKGQISSQEDLNKFISRHTDGSFICVICDKRMRRRDNLRTHVEDQHFRDLFSYPCPDCPMILGSKTKLYNHKKSAHKKCDVSFYSDSNNNQDEPDILDGYSPAKSSKSPKVIIKSNDVKLAKDAWAKHNNRECLG